MHTHMHSHAGVLPNIAHTQAEKCTYAHSDKTERNKAGAPSFSSVGENVLATTGKIDYKLFVDYWGTEKQHYSYPNCKWGEMCGHYTQVRCEMYHACMHVYREVYSMILHIHM